MTAADRTGVALPTGPEKRAAVEEMFDRIAPGYRRLNRIISLGQDGRWRRRTVRNLGLPAGSRVLDLACGPGELCEELLDAGLAPVGLDLSAGMLARSTGRTPMVRGDVLALPFPDGSATGVVCGFALRNLVDLDAFFAECARVLRPGGRVALLDAADPAGRLARAGHRVWFRGVVPWIGARLSDADAYRYLPASTAYLPSGTELVSRLGRAGFDAVQRATMTAGAVQLLTGTRRNPSRGGGGS